VCEGDDLNFGLRTDKDNVIRKAMDGHLANGSIVDLRHTSADLRERFEEL
jgi:hypothetical protein